MAVKNETIFSPKAAARKAGAKPVAKPKAAPKPKAEAKPKAGAKPKAQAKPKAGAKPKAKPKAPASSNSNRAPVVGPYDRPYKTQREKDKQAVIDANAMTLSADEINRQYESETKGAEALKTGYAGAIAAQQAANARAMGTIQGAAGQGVGSALLTGAAASDALGGQGAALASGAYSANVLKDIFGRKNEAQTNRTIDYKANLGKQRALQDTKEEEKQAARIEEKAAGAEFGFKVGEAQRRQQNSDRTYGLALDRFKLAVQKAAKDSSGNIKNIGSFIDNFVKTAAKGGGSKASGPYFGKVSYEDSDGKMQTVDVKNVKFNPAGKTKAQRDSFWLNYLRSQGYDTDTVGPRNVDRGNTPEDTAQYLFEGLTGPGYNLSPQEAYTAILKSVWGSQNAATAGRVYDSYGS
jgi:hypothetical protein